MTHGRILIIDDDFFVRKTLSRVLKQYEIVLAANGEEAIEQLGASEFDVILCDLMMPAVSGIDVYKYLRRVSPAIVDRLVFVTGGTSSDEEQHFIASISNPVLTKPFDFQHLRDLLNEIIARG